MKRIASLYFLLKSNYLRLFVCVCVCVCKLTACQFANARNKEGKKAIILNSVPIQIAMLLRGRSTKFADIK